MAHSLARFSMHDASDFKVSSLTPDIVSKSLFESSFAGEKILKEVMVKESLGKQSQHYNWSKFTVLTEKQTKNYGNASPLI